LKDPALAAMSLAPVPFVVIVAFRYGKRSRPAIQEVQQRIGELTAEAEENVSGVRVVKAFAAEPRQLERFRHQVRRVFDQAMYANRLSAFYQPFIGFLPQLGLAAILLVGGRRSSTAASAGRLHGLLHVPADAIAPMRRSASRSACPARTASGARCSRCSTASRGSSAAGARRCPGHGPRGAARRPSLRATAAACCATSTSTSRAARRCARRRTARASRRSCGSSGGSTT
jgi:hypothetical protein